MNENYLLNNETAKKLYFEYAKNLPIISLSSQKDPSQRIYSNVTEAFLINDSYKLSAIRDCGVDEKFITGDASDYEKFKIFCSVLPKFAGHPIYLLCHIELKRHFQCQMTICEDNCDRIWNEVNEKILADGISESYIINLTDLECHYSSLLSWIEQLDMNNELTDLPTLENALLTNVSEANRNGCRVALYNAFTNFVRPNPYYANEIVKSIKSGDKNYELEDLELVDMQIARTLGKEYKKLGWSWLLKGSYIDENALEYLKSNDALPKTKTYIEFEIGQSEDHLELQLRGYAMKYPLGNLICTVNNANNCLCYARNDYLRRVICNIIGRWVENGEYTSDEKVLKKLIEDILYNNLKEAIS